MIKLELNQELNGIEVYFENKPEQETINQLKNNSFRWSNFKKCWYAKQTEDRISFAQNLTGNTNFEITDQTPTNNKKTKNKILPLWDRCQFVTGNTNEKDHDYHTTGSNYNSKLTNKEIALIFRKHLKAQFPEVKFSVRCEGYNSIDIRIKESPYSNNKLDYNLNLDPASYREYEKEQNKELLVIKEYCDKLHASYNFNNSDSMSDYFHVNYYGHADIAYDYIQTEQTEEDKKTIEEFRNKLLEVEKEEEIQKELRYQEYEKQREIDQKNYELQQIEHNRQVEYINNNITTKDLEESSQYMIMGSQFANLNKNNTIEEYQEEITKGKYYLQNAKITKEIHFNNEESLNYFSNNLLTDFDFLSDTGGSYTEDKRINSMIDYNNMDEEERKTVVFNVYAVAVYLNNELKYIVDAQGYNYARYVGLCDNVTIEKIDNNNNATIDPEIEILKNKVDTLEDYSIEVITDLDISKSWNTDNWNEYKEGLKEKLYTNNFKLTKEIIQQIEGDSENLKVAMYKLLKEVDGIQEQFEKADLKQGQKVTMFYISDWGGIVKSQITVESIEYKSYAQYTNNVKVTFKPQNKRSLYYNNFHSTLLVYNGWLDLPDHVLSTIEESNGFIIKKSKYGSCDKKQFDEIIQYFLGIEQQKPIINTHKPIM